VICVSTSLRRRAVELGLVTPENAVVLANGTCNGIAYNCFAPNAATHEESKKLRAQLGIPPDAPVLGFVGRFTNDKGVRELLAAFHLLRAVVPGLQLLMVGDFEQGDAVPITLRRQIEDDSSIVRPGFVNDTAPYYPLMDVLALPTYREGFGCVALEAACAGVPTVTTTATGAVDAVVDGVTGFNVPVGDVEALTTALARLLNDAELCKRMGAAAQERVRKDFRQEVIWEALLKLYRDLMRERGITERRAQEYSPARLA
jgi:glycosyltransferase involved in cell wall biosynthesis